MRKSIACARFSRNEIDSRLMVSYGSFGAFAIRLCASAGTRRTRNLRSTPSVSPFKKSLVLRGFHTYRLVFKGTWINREGVRVYVNLCATIRLVYWTKARSSELL
ncbi:hypothetical protein PCAR4_50075 [Paraburkholderia caribensis]|nr:hypothetical protein PCAR4_50075 [Paraburkholderia caribensis]